MSTLEEEIVRPLKEQLSLQAQNGHGVVHPSKVPLFLRWWQHALLGLFTLCLSIGICGLYYLKSDWGKTWLAAHDEFQWLVFVNGSSLAVDEVGRFLKQLDGVREVIYQSPEDTAQQFRGENLTAALNVLDANPFPPCWRVLWQRSEIG